MPPSISHLFSANDSFVFYYINLSEVVKVKEVLEDYCKLSEQHVIFNKSAIYYGRCSSFTRVLHVRILNKNETSRGWDTLHYKKEK